MHLKRTTTIAVVGGAFAAWLAGAATSNRPLPPPPIVPPSPIDAQGAALSTEITRLHDRLRPEATPRQPGRNLFVFRQPAIARPSTIAPASPVPVSNPEANDAPAPSLAQPPLALAGIAEDAGPDGPVRTAIISGGGQVFLVKLGAAVTPRYRVEKISPDGVELKDLADGSLRRLALK